MTLDPELDEFCYTQHQKDVLAAVRKVGTLRGAAKALGIQYANLHRIVALVKQRAAKRGYAPEHDFRHCVPEGFKLRGTSTLYGDDGELKQQWVKSEADKERQEQLVREAFEAMASQLPKEPKVKAPGKTDADLLNCYVITDYHLGMLAWHEETGDDWDTAIAEETLVSWFASAIKSAPAASVGVFAQLGDMLHWDGLDAVTPAHHNLLDADTRFQKLVRVAIRAIRRIVRMLLKKHDQVHVVMAEGNHDPASSIWLREWMYALYEDEPRVTVDRNADPYYCYEHGSTSLFFHHGHKRKPADIDHVFAAKFRDVFGRTKHSYAHMGHLHHIDVKETNLMVVEQHRTLAAKDAYASRGGYLAGRSASAITYHRDHGEVGRVTVTPDMLQS